MKYLEGKIVGYETNEIREKFLSIPSKEEMKIGFKGETIEVAFNPRYFIESLNVMDDEKIHLNIVDEEKPCLIEGETDKNYLSVIMPMRI